MTPGQAAYEAFLPGGPIGWEYADAEVRAMWEAAAAAVAAPLNAEVARLTEALAVALAQRNQLSIVMERLRDDIDADKVRSTLTVHKRLEAALAELRRAARSEDPTERPSP